MNTQELSPDPHHDVYSKTVFGFWLYLLTDFMLFATIFAAYAVLRESYFGGPTQKELFNLSHTTVQTLIFLISTFTISIAGVYTHRRKKIPAITFFLISFVFGAIFLGMEIQELSHFIAAGSKWDKSAFASMLFSLVGIFILHLIFALLWLLILLIPVFYSGIKARSVLRLTCLKMFWQFLGIVWAFIYTIVYLLGVV